MDPALALGLFLSVPRVPGEPISSALDASERRSTGRAHPGAYRCRVAWAGP